MTSAMVATPVEPLERERVLDRPATTGADEPRTEYLTPADREGAK